MSRTAFLRWGAIYALVLSAVVIALAGYYDGLGLLPTQIVYIAGSSYVPFFAFARLRRTGLIEWLFVGIALAITWGYVIYLDTRPYEGGGATMNPILGWFSSALISLVPLGIRVVSRLRQFAPNSRWRKSRGGDRKRKTGAGPIQ